MDTLRPADLSEDETRVLLASGLCAAYDYVAARPQLFAELTSTPMACDAGVVAQVTGLPVEQVLSHLLALARAGAFGPA
jgi:hypothetical protein